MVNINTNLSSLIVQQSLRNSTLSLNQAIEQMTTGFKINSAKDNAANFAISRLMNTRISSYNIAEDNVATGIDLLNSANSSMELMTNGLIRLRGLAEQASNGTYGSQSLNAINSEVNSIIDEIYRIYSTSEYNGKHLFGEPIVSGSSSSGSSSPAGGSGKVTGEFQNEISQKDTSQMTKLSEVEVTDKLQKGTYKISSVEDLQKLAEITNSGKLEAGSEFVLENDIDMSSVDDWAGIGSDLEYVSGNGSGYFFEGTFDGNGHVIRNFKFNPKVDFETEEISGVGLFISVKNANIKNLGVENMTGTTSVAGGLVASCVNSTVDNCYTTGSINIDSDGIYLAGGLCLMADNSTIKNSYSSVDITNISNGCSYGAGGLVGALRDSDIENCTYSGTFTDTTGQGYTGGLVGNVSAENKNCIIKNCTMSGKISEPFGILLCMVSGEGDYKCIIQDTKYNGNNSSKLHADFDSYGFDETKLEMHNVTPLDGTPSRIGMYAPVSAVPAMISAVEGSVPYNTDFTFQVGIDSGDSSKITINTGFSLAGLEELRNIGLDDGDYLGKIDSLLEVLNGKQTELGACQNRLESALEEIGVQVENLTSSLSTVRDADIAELSSEYIRQQILQQASATLLAAANQSPSIALQLI